MYTVCELEKDGITVADIETVKKSPKDIIDRFGVKVYNMLDKYGIVVMNTDKIIYLIGEDVSHNDFFIGGRYCKDGGTCHHNCINFLRCDREYHSSPLSITGASSWTELSCACSVIL